MKILYPLGAVVGGAVSGGLILGIIIMILQSIGPIKQPDSLQTLFGAGYILWIGLCFIMGVYAIPSGQK